MIRWHNLLKNRKSKSRTRFLAAATSGQATLDLVVVNLTSDAKSLTSNFDAAIAAVNYQVEQHFQPEWGVGGKLTNKTADYNLYLNQQQQGQITGAEYEQLVDSLVEWILSQDNGIDWTKTGIVYVADPNTSGSFGGIHQHDKVNDLDIPWALVGVWDANWSVVLSHEVLELLADPWGTNFVKHFSNDPVTFIDQSGETQSKVIPEQDWIVEVCDSVEANDDGYNINGVQVSNFNSQAYFNTSATSGLDYRNLLRRDNPTKYPFPIRPGGYLSFWVGDALNPDELYQIKWGPDQKEAVYYQLYLKDDEAREKVIAQLRKERHSGHRLLKYRKSRLPHRRAEKERVIKREKIFSKL